MRQRFLILLAVMTLGALSHIRGAETATVTVNNLIFEVSDSEAAVTGIANDAITSCEIPESITYDGITYKVTSIGNQAFYQCARLNSIKIPESVTFIGEEAFAECPRLTGVTLPNSITSIEKSTFYKCSALLEIRIPDSVTSIGMTAFYGCSRLSEVTIGNSVRSIGSHAFGECTTLTEVRLPDSVTSLAHGAFISCYNLTDITLGNSLTSIGEYAFNYCTSLPEIKLPDSVTSIGQGAFQSCHSLSKITFGRSIERIDEYAFNDCRVLSNVIIPNLTGWCSVVFGNTDSNPISITHTFRIAENVNSVKHLDINLPGQTIAPYAFYGALNLQTVRINAKEIGEACFQYCYNVEHICLNTETLGKSAFMMSNYHSSIYSLYSMTDIPPGRSLGSLCFDESETILYIPFGCSTNYTEYWQNYKEIRECDFSDLDSIFKADHEPIGAVVNLSADSTDFNLTVTDGVISAEAAPDTMITIHNLQGACIHAGKGNLSVAVVPGMYIVTAGSRSKKIAVR